MRFNSLYPLMASVALLLWTVHAQSKPIAFANGTTIMAEYGAGTMTELQTFYAPQYWWSVGVGYVRFDAEDGTFIHDISYARANLLLKRWNLPSAQANVFAWGGLGVAHGDGVNGSALAYNAGWQIDYETRRVYAALKSDLQASDAFSHRIDTVQLGVAPYAHDYNTLATWFVFQGRQYTGGLANGTEWALLLRLFKGGTWIEAGFTTDGKPQAMLMINF